MLILLSTCIGYYWNDTLNKIFLLIKYNIIYKDKRENATYITIYNKTHIYYVVFMHTKKIINLRVINDFFYSLSH